MDKQVLETNFVVFFMEQFDSSIFMNFYSDSFANLP